MRVYSFEHVLFTPKITNLCLSKEEEKIRGQGAPRPKYRTRALSASVSMSDVAIRARLGAWAKNRVEHRTSMARRPRYFARRRRRAVSEYCRPATAAVV